MDIVGEIKMTHDSSLDDKVSGAFEPIETYKKPKTKKRNIVKKILSTGIVIATSVGGYYWYNELQNNDPLSNREVKIKQFTELEDRTMVWSEKKEISQSLLHPFVFVHGNAQNHTSGNALIEHMNFRGHTTLVYDLPGHGKSSEYQNGKYSLDRFSQTLDRVLSEYGIEKPIIAVHSMGGMIALQYVADNPEKISGLILIDTSDVDPSLVNAEIPVRDAVKQIVDGAYKSFKKENRGLIYPFDENPQLSEDEILGIGLQYTIPKSLEGNFNAVFEDYDVRDKMAQIDVPTLIIRGAEDVLMTAKMTEDMHKRIKNSRLVTVPGYGHNFLIQRPDLLIKIIEENYDFIAVGKK